LTIPELLERVQPISKQSPERMNALIAALQNLDGRNIAGDIVECGVWRGATAIISRIISPDRKVWMYDTFDGMTAPERIDVSHLGRSALLSYQWKIDNGGKWAKATLTEVMGNLATFGISDGVVPVIGDVSTTLLDFELPFRIALLRLDTDFYRSTLIELQMLYPRLARGGILIIDDYGHWLGARQAVNEYFGFEPVDIWHWSRFVKIDSTAVMLVKD
jgi:O-methyltransferase